MHAAHLSDVPVAGTESALASMVEFLFLHSYARNARNWRAVMNEAGRRAGRVETLKRLAGALSLPR